MSLAIAWTTVATEADARRLAHGAVAARLAACVQLSGPIRSVYRWEGKVVEETEWRLTFKVTLGLLPALEDWVIAQHPYSVPEWIVITADHTHPAYLAWAQGTD